MTPELITLLGRAQAHVEAAQELLELVRSADEVSFHSEHAASGLAQARDALRLLRGMALADAQEITAGEPF